MGAVLWFSLRAEIADLVAAGAQIIQVDESAIRELLPFARRAAAGLLAVGGRGVSSGDLWSCARGTDPYPHVLLGVQRAHRHGRGSRRRCHLHRGWPETFASPQVLVAAAVKARAQLV
ncbi:5-methyltetrahydropteroyltriglutamate--homocysteine methyltransferase [Corynebacterium diphtheriae]|nr:5-methyltetrahydropteroyltriglutamate--homocysteine methyltransferase [Corynebacterium diphtheriae]